MSGHTRILEWGLINLDVSDISLVVSDVVERARRNIISLDSGHQGGQEGWM
jgi:hypothetical protein